MIKKIKEVPEGIRILTFLFFAGAFILLLIGSFVLNYSDSFRVADPALLASAGLDIVNPWAMVLVGIALIGFSILSYFIGRDLSRARNWAKITVGIFSALGIVSAIMNISNMMYVGGLLGLVMNGIVAWYLFVNKKSKSFFK